MNDPRSPRTRRRGFTLIELIVVVIIIAVLAAIAAVAYNQYAAKARSNAVLASATDLRTAVMAASAQADTAPATEVDTLWTQAGGDAGAFLKALSASYAGPLTYTPGDGTAPATLQVAASSGGSHSACLTLPSTVSVPVTVSAGDCPAPTGDAGGDVPPIGDPNPPQCVLAPAPLIGCIPQGTATSPQSWTSRGLLPPNALDGDLNTFWDSSAIGGTWQVALNSPAAVSSVSFAYRNDPSAGGTLSITVSEHSAGDATGAWTQIAAQTFTAGIGGNTYVTVPVTPGTYDGLQIVFKTAGNVGGRFADLAEVAIS